eukprot:scaffold686_cov437-Pavlova_lutheri.AAC.4
MELRRDLARSLATPEDIEEERDREKAIAFQGCLKGSEPKAPLPGDLLHPCHQPSVCDICYRCGHSGSGCQASVVFSSKN